MAEQYPQGQAKNGSAVPPLEATDRGCFDFMSKKDDKNQGDLVMTDMNTAGQDGVVEEKHTMMDELQRTHSHSSSSSEEEVEEGGERKKKKKKQKGLKETIKEKLTGEKKEGENAEERKCAGDPMEKQYEAENAETIHSGEKGLLEKIKEKLPGQQHKSGEDHDSTTQAPIAPEHCAEHSTKEKKGIMDKIMDKLPGHHKGKEHHELKED